MQLAPLDDPARPTLASILARCYGVPPEKASAWLDIDGSEPRVARVDGEVVGSLLRIPMAQAFGGRFVPTVGVAAVGIATERRRRGHASSMMRALLREARDAGTPLSTLYASNQPLYRGVGYERAGSRYLLEVRPRDLGVSVDGGTIEQGGDAHGGEVEALYRDVAVGTAGHLDRGPYVWRLVRGGESWASLLRDDDGVLEGVLRYRHRTVGTTRTLVVSDAVARTPRGWRRLLSHLSDLGPLVETIELPSAPSDPLWLAQPHPFGVMKLQETWLVRVIDPEAALRARGYPEGVRAAVRLRVVDPDLGDTTLRLSVEDGHGEVAPSRDAEVTTSVRGLAAVYTGFLHPTEARSAGLLDGDPAALSRLGAILAGPRPWMRDFF